MSQQDEFLPDFKLSSSHAKFIPSDGFHLYMGKNSTPLWGKKTLLYRRKYQPLLGLKITNFPGFFEGGRIHLLYVVVLSSGFILLVVIFQLHAKHSFVICKNLGHT